MQCAYPRASSLARRVAVSAGAILPFSFRGGPAPDHRRQPLYSWRALRDITAGCADPGGDRRPSGIQPAGPPVTPAMGVGKCDHLPSARRTNGSN